MSDFETWKNISAGKVWVNKLDRRGDPSVELVPSQGVFRISSEDRRFNQDAAANDRLDVFKNGMLVPVRLLDGSEDVADIASNPNLMSESDMVSLFSVHHKTFVSRLGEVSNTITLNRLLDIARERDEKLSKISAIEARLAELSPSVVAVEREVVSDRAAGMPSATLL